MNASGGAPVAEAIIREKISIATSTDCSASAAVLHSEISWQAPPMAFAAIRTRALV